MKNRNNKGFSLVELIVVVAIMAVLVGVLAPAYLKYVEQSREKKDLNNIEEVRHAVEIALADEAVFAEVTDGATVKIGETTTTGGTKTVGTIAVTDTADDNFEAALEAAVGTTLELVSKKYNTEQTITINITSGVVKVTCTPAFNS